MLCLVVVPFFGHISNRGNLPRLFSKVEILNHFPCKKTSYLFIPLARDVECWVTLCCGRALVVVLQTWVGGARGTGRISSTSERPGWVFLLPQRLREQQRKKALFFGGGRGDISSLVLIVFAL